MIPCCFSINLFSLRPWCSTEMITFLNNGGFWCRDSTSVWRLSSSWWLSRWSHTTTAKSKRTYILRYDRHGHISAYQSVIFDLSTLPIFVYLKSEFKLQKDYSIFSYRFVVLLHSSISYVRFDCEPRGFIIALVEWWQWQNAPSMFSHLPSYRIALFTSYVVIFWSVSLSVLSDGRKREVQNDAEMVITLVERYGKYTTDYDTNTSVKRIKTLRNIVASITAVWIIDYGLFTIEWRVCTWKVRCPLSHVILIMWLPLNTEFYGGYSTENDGNTAVYDTVSTRVTNHPGNDDTDSWLLFITVSLFGFVLIIDIGWQCIWNFKKTVF